MKARLRICAVICLMLMAASVQATIITSAARTNGCPDAPGSPSIVAGPSPRGLQVGSQAFLDRSDPLNTFYTWEIIPPELLGADYVMTYNDDKTACADNVSYSVALGQEARLYIFIDQRYLSEEGEFPWLTDGSSGATFTDTGLIVTLFEGGQNGRHVLTDFHVYEASVSSGTYTPGSTYRGSTSRNFYSIAAVGSETEFGGTIYVDDDAPSDPAPGDFGISDPEEDGTEKHPFDSIQEGIDVAPEGATVLVREGTYWETIDFKGKAIRVHGRGGAEATTIDGGGSGSVVRCTEEEGIGTTLEGFTITGGKAPNGGGMYNVDSSPTILGCMFEGNVADSRGGGIYNNNSHPTVTDCTFSGNAAVRADGGGMTNDNSSPTVSDCTFRLNSAKDGGGGMHNRSQSHPIVTGCTFDRNLAEDGGAMQNFIDSSPTLSNCTFTDNLADGGNGGGIDNTHDSNPIVNGCTFRENSAKYGGAMLSGWGSGPVVANCLLFENSAEWGGGMYHIDSGAVEIINCTFRTNLAQSNAGAMYNDDSIVAMTNSIVWGNIPNGIGGSATITYSDVEDGWAGEGNIEADPLFLGDGNSRLQAGSFCIDAGSNAAVYSSTDLDGNVRTQGEAVDMGAYEWTTVHATIPLLISPDENAMLDNGRSDSMDDMVWDFDWSDVPGAMEYHLHVQNVNAASAAIDLDGLTSSNYHSVSPGSYIVETYRFDWLWKVRARVDGAWQDWSETRSFYVEPLDTDSPVNMAPVVTVDVLLTTDSTPPLTGTVNDPDAIIEVELEGEVYSASNIGDGTWILADDTIDPPLDDGIYHVTVTATDQVGNSAMDNTVNELTIGRTGTLYVVDSSADTIAADGETTLPEAIYAANYNSTIGDAQAGSDTCPDVVIFDPALAGSRILLTGDMLWIMDDLWIAGLGSDQLTIDGDGKNRLIYIQPNVMARISNVTMTGSTSSPGGGAVNNRGVLVLNNCALSGNIGDCGMYNHTDGSLTMRDCEVSENVGDGGVHNYGTALLESCAITGNSLSDYSPGGGIGNDGSMILTDCLISGNTSNGNAGGISNGNFATMTIINCDIVGNTSEGNGGALANWDSTVTLVNCHISGNTAKYGGGLSVGRSNVTLADSTVAGNSAVGIHSYATGGICVYSGTIGLQNTIVALNTATTFSPDIHEMDGVVESASSNNFIGDSGGLTGIADGENGNMIGRGDPMFVRAPVAGADGQWGTEDDDYGDLRLQTASPCIDTGNNELAVDEEGNPLTVDRLGNPRIVNGVVDIGAYEYNAEILP